ncbi:MAG: hypothetical protein HWD59_07460 [Coxiellaceae bacterium]|nr:MAG: hypothetical protein HWD59_07460 [Coxiellaceae bacterium]
MILKLKEYKPRRKLTPKLFHEFIAILSQNYKADIKTILDIETKQLGIKLWQSPNYGLVWLPDNFQPNAKANYNDALYGYFSNHYRFIELGLALSDLFDLLSQVVSPKSDNNNQEHDELILLMPLSRNIVKTFNLLEKAVSSATEKNLKLVP